MPPTDRPKPHLLVATLNAISGISGLLALFSLSVFGGEMKRQQVIDTARIEKLEHLPAAVETHEKMDDTRVSDMMRRLAALESIAAATTEMKADVKVLRANLDWLIKQKTP